MRDDDWPRVPFTEAVRDCTGGNIKIQRRDYQLQGTLPVIDQSQDFIAGYVSDAGSAYRGKLPVVLFGDHTRCFKYVDFPFALGADGVKVLNPQQGFNAEFLHYFFRSVNLPSAGYSRHFKFLREVYVPKPQIEEQRRIVDILSRAEGIVRLRREAQKIAAELIPALFFEMFGDPATNPKGWPVHEIGKLGRVQLGRQRTPKYQTGLHTRPYMRVANVFEDRIDTSDVLSMDFDKKDFVQYRLSAGDILLNEGQSTDLVGRPAMWRNEIDNCCFQNTLVRFQPAKGVMNSEFALAALLHYYRSGVLSRISSKTSNVAHLGGGRFAKLPLFCPPINLQSSFGRKFKLMTSLREQEMAAVRKAEATFETLLTKIFTEAYGGAHGAE